MVVGTYLKSMIRVPTRLATLVLENAMERRRITLAVVKLKRTSVSMNFQNETTVGTKPMSPYTMPPKTRGGTTRSGKISNMILEKKYVKEE